MPKPHGSLHWKYYTCQLYHTRVIWKLSSAVISHQGVFIGSKNGKSSNTYFTYFVSTQLVITVTCLTQTLVENVSIFLIFFQC